jgi:hypothetical protein
VAVRTLGPARLTRLNGGRRQQAEAHRSVQQRLEASSAKATGLADDRPVAKDFLVKA